MTRESLILSDTAMVLLRRYRQIQEDSAEVFASLEDREQEKRPEWYSVPAFVQEESQVAQELFFELWLLWSFGDVSYLRRLDWHVVIEGDVMKRLNELCQPTPVAIHAGSVTIHRSEAMTHMADLLVQVLNEQRLPHDS